MNFNRSVFPTSDGSQRKKRRHPLRLPIHLSREASAAGALQATAALIRISGAKSRATISRDRPLSDQLKEAMTRQGLYSEGKRNKKTGAYCGFHSMHRKGRNCMEIFCFVAGLLLGVFAGFFCMSLMKTAADSDITMQEQAEKHFGKHQEQR